MFPDDQTLKTTSTWCVLVVAKDKHVHVMRRFSTCNCVGPFSESQFCLLSVVLSLSWTSLGVCSFQAPMEIELA